MRRSLASLAQHELNGLVQDTKKAITDLEHQRQSVLQAIEVAQMADGHNGHSTGETEMLLIELVDRLLRLNDALDQVVQEAEQIEQAQPSPASQRHSESASERASSVGRALLGHARRFPDFHAAFARSRRTSWRQRARRRVAYGRPR